MKYLKTNNKRQQVLNSFSDQELIDFSNKVANFAFTKLNFLTPEEAELSQMKVVDPAVAGTEAYKDYSKNWNNQVLKSALIGGGLGAGVGGIYGALTGKNKKERLKRAAIYGLLGSGIGGIGGLLHGSYSDGKTLEGAYKAGDEAYDKQYDLNPKIRDAQEKLDDLTLGVDDNSKMVISMISRLEDPNTSYSEKVGIKNELMKHKRDIPIDLFKKAMGVKLEKPLTTKINDKIGKLVDSGINQWKSVKYKIVEG